MAERQRICAHCGNQFSYAVGRGHDRLHCGSRCASLAARQRHETRLADAPSCSVEGCGASVRSIGAGLCEKHYMRLRRNGHYERKSEVFPPAPELPHSHGYVAEHLPDHALWGETRGRIYQHRRVFFDHYGKGPFDCHWCGVLVTWGTMHVDHVNAVPSDNRIENLVPSCPACNVRRGNAKMKATHRAKSSAQIEWRGETRCISEWAERIGITATSLRWRLDNGWTFERAMSEGRGKTGPRRAA